MFSKCWNIFVPSLKKAPLRWSFYVWLCVVFVYSSISMVNRNRDCGQNDSVKHSAIGSLGAMPVGFHAHWKVSRILFCLSLPYFWSYGLVGVVNNQFYYTLICLNSCHISQTTNGTVNKGHELHIIQQIWLWRDSSSAMNQTLINCWIHLNENNTHFITTLLHKLHLQTYITGETRILHEIITTRWFIYINGEDNYSSICRPIKHLSQQ